MQHRHDESVGRLARGCMHTGRRRALLDDFGLGRRAVEAHLPLHSRRVGGAAAVNTRGWRGGGGRWDRHEGVGGARRAGEEAEEP